MDESLLALGKRARACPGWRWMEGMKPTTGGDDHYARTRRCGWTWNDYREEWSRFMGLDFASGAPAWGWPSPTSGWVPDLSDPATLGCLLALVREVHFTACVVPPTSDDRPWRVSALNLRGVQGATEAEALVAALEATGRRP